MLGTTIDDNVANSVIAQMFFLEMQDASQDISLYINSPGGSVHAGLAIYDIMQFVRCDVATYCIGLAASMGSLLLSAGTAKKTVYSSQCQSDGPPASCCRIRNLWTGERY